MTTSTSSKTNGRVRRDGTARLIVTHNGCAHQDDFVACCMALAANPDATLERRNPTKEELVDPAVWVIDVGRAYSDVSNNFDHHQFPKGDDVCSVHLVLNRLLVRMDAEEVYGWLDLYGIQDCRGLMAAAKSVHPDLTPPQYLAIKGPTTKVLCDMFKDDPEFLIPVMRRMGHYLFDQIEFFHERITVLAQKSDDMVEVKGFRVLDMRGYDNPGAYLYDVFGDVRPQLLIMDSIREEGNVTIKSEKSIGGPCLSIYTGHPEVPFVHTSGFLMEINKGIDPFEILSEL